MTTRTDEAIKRGFRQVLAHKPLSRMSISEVARAAGVSRSTFYAHYANLGELYEAAVADFAAEISPLMPQIGCAACDARCADAGAGDAGVAGTGAAHAGRERLCEALRDPGEHAAVVDEERFVGTFLSEKATLSGHDLFAVLTSAGYGVAEARALCRFQLGGCIIAARGAHADDAEWDGIRELLDTFIEGGLRACLAAKERDNRRSARGGTSPNPRTS